MSEINVDTIKKADGTGNLTVPAETGTLLTTAGGVLTGDLTLETNGIYLGGTGAANKLDDYEEGTWTPTYSAVSNPTVTYDSRTGGTYVKVGKLVTVSFAIVTDALSGGSGAVYLSNLPFTNQNDGSSEAEYSAVSISWTAAFAGDHPMSGIVNPNTTSAALTYRTAANGATSYLDVSDLGTGTNDNLMYGSIIYYTDL